MSEHHVSWDNLLINNFYLLFLILRQADWKKIGYKRLILEPTLYSYCTWVPMAPINWSDDMAIFAIYFHRALWILHKMNLF